MTEEWDRKNNYESCKDKIYKYLNGEEDISSLHEYLAYQAELRKYPDIIKLLLRYGANVFYRTMYPDEEPQNAIEAAFLNERDNNVEILNAVVENVPLSKQFQIRYMVCTAKKPLPPELIPHPESSLASFNGSTLLMDAVRFNRPLPVVRQLIEAGYDVNARGNYGYTALFFTDRPKMIQFLIDNGADITVKSDSNSFFCDNLGFYDEMLPILKIILKQKPPKEMLLEIWRDLTVFISVSNLDDPDDPDCFRTPGEMIKAFHLLLNAGVDVNYNERTAEWEGPSRTLMLHETVKFGHISMVKYLLKRGADPNIVDGMGNTALIGCAYEHAGIKVAKMLIEAGADPYWRTNDGYSFMDMIKDQYYDEMVAWLKKREKKNGGKK